MINMKNIIKGSFKLFLILIGTAIMIVSCEYETNVRPATYPDQIIYMPAAYGGNFVINDIARRIGDPPVPGQPFRYVVDTAARKFSVPLSVYRAGINNDGAFKVDIAAKSDTITKLILAGKLLNTVLLDQTKYSIITSVDMPDGKELATFSLIIDLDFLRQSYPASIFALGVGVSSTQRASNPLLATTIVVIDSKIMKPTPNFTQAADASDPKKINFTNSSLMSVRYLWNFGDGSAISSVVSPSHNYVNAGTYTITLTAIGITGMEDKSIKTAVISVL
jgi:hypothetical protein